MTRLHLVQPGDRSEGHPSEGQSPVAGPAPALDSTGLERQLRRVFDRIAPFTIGVEEELLLVDPETFEPAEAAELAVALAEGDRRVAYELRASQIEAITPICVTVADVERELASIRRLVAARLGTTASLLASGTHPLAHEPGAVTCRPRYEQLAAANPWAARYALTCGLHVHVSVGGAERTLAVYNALRGYLPEIIALAANAPIFRGEDSGLATVRPKLNQCWPRAGVPPAFAAWRDVADFARWAERGGAFPDETHQWWDLRLRPRFGTIEVRAADVQTRVEDSATVAALIQALAYELAARYDAGDLPPIPRDERIVENAWLATRDGVDGWLIDLETGERVSTADRLHGLAERLLPSATALGADRELLGIGRIVLEGGGAGRQRRAFRDYAPEAAVSVLAAETTTPSAVAAEIVADGTPPWAAAGLS
jgi:glutamate---cysteine ligase / carboxylate-amine ligase